jgi:predicted nucleotidyltransferase
MVLMEQNIMQELVAGILAVMQEQVVSIILYGSVARGTNTEDSDIDIDKFSTWETAMPFYRNVKKEGIVLWKAA